MHVDQESGPHNEPGGELIYLEVDRPPRDEVEPSSEAPAKESSEESKTKQKTKPPKKIDVALSIANVMLRNKLPDWPKFPFKFHLKKDGHGGTMLLEEDKDEVCHYVIPKEVGRKVIQYCIRTVRNNNAKMFHKNAMDVVELWMSLAKPLEEDAIASVLEHSTPGKCYQRLPFDFVPNDDPSLWPHFAEIMSRASNAGALMQWLGSIFVPNSDLHQYCWLYGAGRNSKSAMSRVLQKLLGPAYSTERAPKDEGNQFWTSGFSNARLVCFPDCNNYEFPTSGLFKALSGGDPMRVEIKRGDIYTTKFKAKYFFHSNERPKISSQASDMRRAIFCELEPAPKTVDPAYEEKLWAEAPYFLGHCIGLYKKACPNGEPIGIDQDALEDLAFDNESPYELLFRRRFKLHEGKRLHAEQFGKILIEEKIFSTKEQKAFKDFMERRYGIKRKRHRLDETSDRQWCYEGLAELTLHEKTYRNMATILD